MDAEAKKDESAKIDFTALRHDTPVIAVLGTGRYGRALSERLLNAGYDVRVGSRTPAEGQYLSADAVEAASIVFFCVPPFAHDSLLSSIKGHLHAGDIVVDIANHGLAAPPRPNAPSIAERLADTVPEGVVVAKALNTLAAETLEKDPLPTIVPPPARIACDDRVAVAKLSAVFTDCTLAPVMVGPLMRARDLEQLAHRQFPTWHIPTYVSVLVFAFWMVYYSLYTYVALVPASVPGMEPRPVDATAEKLPMKMLIHVMAETGMTLFAATFIAGPIATLVQLVRGNGSSPFTPWLTTWLNMRKELGLIALGFILPHSLAGITEVGTTLRTLDLNLFYMFGFLSFSAFAIMSVSSFPSVASGLSWREARAVFSWLGLLAFAMGAAHHFIYALKIDKQNPPNYPRIGSLPLLPTGWLGFIIVVATFVLRSFVWSPCIVMVVRRMHWDKRFDTTI